MTDLSKYSKSEGWIPNHLICGTANGSAHLRGINKISCNKLITILRKGNLTTKRTLKSLSVKYSQPNEPNPKLDFLSQWR